MVNLPDMAIDDDIFSFHTWTPNTEVTLTNVPWNNDYRDIVRPSAWSGIDAYINAQSDNRVYTNASYMKLGQPIFLPHSINKVAKYNYVRITNGSQPVTNGDSVMTYYYFILSVAYDSPNATRVELELDIWATFGRFVEFGNCYIERGHVGIANENQWSNYGRDYLTVPEGLDTGDAYSGVFNRRYAIMQMSGADTPHVAVLSTIDLSKRGRDDDGLPVQHPAPSATIDGIQTGAAVYVMEPLAFFSIIDYYAQLGEPWVTSGIVSARLIPNATKYYNATNIFKVGDAPSTIRPVNALRNTVNVNLWTNFRDQVRSLLPERYRGLRKFLTSPYMMIEMTTFTGSSVFLRPELWDNSKAEIQLRTSIMPGNERLVSIARGYNSRGIYEYDNLPGEGGTVRNGDDHGDYLDTQVQIANFPQIPVQNDNGAIAAARGEFGRNQARDSANWAYAKNMAANSVSYDNTRQSVDASGRIGEVNRNLASQQTALSNDTAARQLGVNAVTGIVGGASGGLVAGPQGAAVGAITGAGNAMASVISHGIQADANTQSTNLSNNASRNISNIEASNTMGIADRNSALASYAAKGDYANQIAAIDASARETQMIPASLSGQFGGDFMQYAYDGMNIHLRFKMVDSGTIARIGEYWLRYGYKINRFMKPPTSLHVMSKFTYWKMSETYIKTAPIPEFFKQAIRGIFEKGVTVWRDPSDIGNVDAGTNQPLGGISY